MSDTSASSSDRSPSDHTGRLRHFGNGGELFAIHLRNLALSALTLGFYRFWAKTRIRRYLWSQTEFMDEALEYTGTGRELFLGFLIVAAALAVASLAYQLAGIVVASARFELAVAVDVLAFAGVTALIGVAVYRARRYRISRTLWRGIRGAQTGSSVQYGLKYLGYWVLNVVSIGWTHPWMRMKLVNQLINHTWFGDRRFRFHCDARPLYGPFAIVWAALFLASVGAASTVILAMSVAPDLRISGLKEISPTSALLVMIPVLLWIICFVVGATWYKVREYAHIAASTGYEGLTFGLNATFGSLLWLLAGNLLIRTLTLGLGTPFVLLRTARYACRRTAIDGEADFDAIRQSSQERPGLGEGLAAALDVGDF